MATVFSEDFGGGAPGATITTGNTIFTSIDTSAGAVPGTFDDDSYTGTLQCMNVTVSAQTSSHAVDHSSAGGWFGFGLRILAPTFTVNTAIVNWFNGATKGGDVRILPDRTLQLRNVSSSVFISPVLSEATWYWVAVKRIPNSATGHRMKIYQAGALISGGDSGDQVSSAAVGGFTLTRFGSIGNATGQIRFARLRADDTSEPSSGITASTAEAVYTRRDLVEIDTAGSTGTMTLTQTAGTTATILEPSTGLFEIVPPAAHTDTLSFGLTATSGGDTDTKTITVDPSGAGGGSNGPLVFLDGSWEGVAGGGGGTPAPTGGYLIGSKARLDSLATSGAGWTYLLNKANTSRIVNPVVNTYAHEPAQQVLAKAFAWYKLGTQSYKDDVVLSCRNIIGTEEATQSSTPASQTTENHLLATLRMLPAYVIAADLVGMDKTLTGTISGQTGVTWQAWLSDILTRDPAVNAIGTNGRWFTPLQTLASSASNWGAQAAQTCVAISLYLGETTWRDRIVKRVRGMLGDQGSTGHPTYAAGVVPPDTGTNDGAGFRTTSDFDSSFAADYSATLNGWHPVNPTTSTDARMDGIIVEDAGRSSLSWDAWLTSSSASDAGRTYSYEWMTGAYLAAAMLEEAGYGTTTVQAQALRRTFDFMDRNGWYPGAFAGRWGVAWLINHYYGTAYSTASGMSSSTGTLYGYNSSHFWDWLYQ